MKQEIKVPAMGESITEVTIGAILAHSGTQVKADAEVLEIETDKVNQALYAPQAGLLELTVKTGDTVRVGQVIGTIETVTEKVPSEKPKEAKAPIQPAAKPQEKEDSLSRRQTKEDFLADIQKAPAQAPLAQVSPQPTEAVQIKKVEASSTGRETRKRLSNIRRVIAQRLVNVQQETASLTTFNEVDLSQVINLREKYQEAFLKKYGVKLGFMSFFVKASVSALQALPAVNSYIDGEDLVHRDYYDLGIAVGTEKGLIVPVVRDCDQKSFGEIELAIQTAAQKAKEGKLSIEELQGGGFTITNGGVYGSLLSTPILNPPQSAILGMHKIEKRPVAINDQVVIRPMMYLALTYDHRVIDGREAVGFLVHVKNILEEPSRLLLEI